MVGILQEQHPDRAILFMQWQEMGWPLLVDSLNLLEVTVVPITVLVDAHGIIRERPRGIPTADALTSFVTTKFPAPSDPEPAREPQVPDLAPLASAAKTAGNPADVRRYGEHLLLWGGDAALDKAIGSLETCAREAPDHGPTHFRLGVAYRTRYDCGSRKRGDFQHAVDAWSRALALDPNQYIWRRRIQQYGPQLTKPYPFYDWVEQARADVTARGETPAALRVEPGNTERAAPVQQLEQHAQTNPDLDGRVLRDTEGLVTVEATAVPATVAPGEATRVHLTFRPAPAQRGHWNNEAEDLVVWIDPPAGWQIGTRRHSVANPPSLVSDEPRTVEVELRAPAGIGPGPITVQGYALYYVCEDVDGTCLYRRQDIAASVAVVSPSL